MNEKMNEWMDGWMNKWMNGWKLFRLDTMEVNNFQILLIDVTFYI